MNSGSLDIGRALTYMFEEDDWVTKFLIAAAMVLLSVFILPALLLQGYMVEIIRRVGRGDRPVLPVWDNWGKYLSQGFAAAVAQVVYLLPLILFACCAIFPLVLSADPETGELGGGGVLALCCMMIAVFFLQIPLLLVYYAGLVRYAERGDFAAFFQFGPLWSFVRANVGTYGLALIVAFVVSIVGGFVPIVGTAWAQLGTGHLLGQLLRQRPSEGGPPPPTPETPLSGATL